MELKEVEVFLSQHQPFSMMSHDYLETIVQSVEISYFKAGTQIFEFGDEIQHWYVIRSGAVEVYRRNGDLYNRLDEGGFFGEFGLLRNGKIRFPIKALEDTLVYMIPEKVFLDLFDNNQLFADAVELKDRTRLRHAVEKGSTNHNYLMSSKTENLINRELVTISKAMTARDAAIKMAEEHVSSLVVCDDVNTDGSIEGIVTGSDIRNRLVAEGLSYDTPVTSIMTKTPLSVEHNQLVFETMLLMLRFNVHHLLVMRGKRCVGMVSSSDIVRYESQNSLFILSSIFKAQEVEELASLKDEVDRCFVRMVNEGATSHMIGTAMSVIGRSFKQRLLQLAEDKLGTPPIPYCFVALGSMAREEQLVYTDQDNAIILDDSYDSELHGTYFKQLSAFVCDGLELCGYTYCKGEIMATNPKWCQPLNVWKKYFTDWIDKPTPEFLLNSSIFFDLIGVWGKFEWADQLNKLIAEKSEGNRQFIFSLAKTALLRTPPLGFFKEFVMETDGGQSKSINIKRRGTAPLADLVRAHALFAGSTKQNSFDRLDDIIASKILPPGRGPDLRDALELIAMVRIRHMAIDISLNNDPDNNIEPENLSDFERKNLKDAFQVLSAAQKYLKSRYQPGRIY